MTYYHYPHFFVEFYNSMFVFDYVIRIISDYLKKKLFFYIIFGDVAIVIKIQKNFFSVQEKITE